MRDGFSKQAACLTYLGMLPFFIGTVAILVGFEPAKAAIILRAYAAVIVSFISGMHWGIGMQDRKHTTAWLLLTSNAIALVAWGSLFIQQMTSALMTLALLLSVLLLIDIKLYQLKHTESWFIALRKQVTLVVTMLLVVSAVASL